jgi:hypothetical protein
MLLGIWLGFPRRMVAASRARRLASAIWGASAVVAPSSHAVHVINYRLDGLKLADVAVATAALRVPLQSRDEPVERAHSVMSVAQEPVDEMRANRSSVPSDQHHRPVFAQFLRRPLF